MTISLDGFTPTTVTARREVILSAGTIGTAQILQLSGIGNPHDLVSLGIPVIIDNPAVGANLIDHVLLPNIFNVKGEESLDTLLRDPNLLGAAVDEWTANKTGIIANTVANTFGFARLPSNSPILETHGDPASGPKSPHWEIVFAVSRFSSRSDFTADELDLGFLAQLCHCATSYGKFLDFTHFPDYSDIK